MSGTVNDRSAVSETVNDRSVVSGTVSDRSVTGQRSPISEGRERSASTGCSNGAPIRAGRSVAPHCPSARGQAETAPGSAGRSSSQSASPPAKGTIWRDGDEWSITPPASSPASQWHRSVTSRKTVTASQHGASRRLSTERHGASARSVTAPQCGPS